MNRAFLLYKTWLICFVHLVACSQDKFPEKFHFSIISSPWSRGRVWEQYAGGPWFKSTLNVNFFFCIFSIIFFTRWPFPLLKTILNTKKKYFSLYLLRKKGKNFWLSPPGFEPGTSGILFPHSTSRPRRTDIEMEFFGKFILRASNQMYKTNQSSFVK